MLPKHSYASELPGELVTDRKNEFILNSFPSSDPKSESESSSQAVCVCARTRS